MCLIGENGDAPNVIFALILVAAISTTAYWLTKKTLLEVKQSLSMIKVFFTLDYVAESIAWIFSANVAHDDISARKLQDGVFAREHRKSVKKLEKRLELVTYHI
jgi:hypothetical protein